MVWNQSVEERFTQLRQHELTGVLSAEEKAELATIFAFLEQDEAERLKPAFTKIQNDLLEKQEKLQHLRDENRQLASLQAQLELLAVDARHWLAELERRHTLIQQSFSQTIGAVPALS